MKIKFTGLLLISFLTIQNAFAQIEEGTVYLGASSNLSFSSTSIDGYSDNYNNFNLGFQGGYFVAENLALGALINFQKQTLGDQDASTTTLGLFGRYYINGAFFLGAGYASANSKSNGFSGDAVGSIPLEAGYAAFITDAVSIEPSLVYAIGTGDNNTNTVGVNVGFAIYLGR